LGGFESFEGFGEVVFVVFFGGEDCHFGGFGVGFHEGIAIEEGLELFFG